MAVVLIKLIPKQAASGGASTQAATSAATAATTPAKEVDVPGVYSTVKKENKTFNRLLWAGVGSVATLLLVAVFGKSKN